MQSKTVALLHKIAFTILLITIFGSLFVFIPFVPVSFTVSKGFFVSLGAMLALLFWLVASVKSGTYLIPMDRLLIYAATIPIVFLLSALFSSSRYVSLWGNGFDIGTFGSMLSLFLVFFLSSVYFQTEKRIWYFFGSLFVVSLCILLFQFVSLFFDLNSTLPSVLFPNNLVGTWTDFDLLLGIIVIVSLLTFECIKTSRISIIIAQYFLLCSSLFFLIVINIPFVWFLIGLISIVIFIYRIYPSHKIRTPGVSHYKKLPFLTLAIVVLLSFSCLIGSSAINGLTSKYINLLNSDTRPSLGATFLVARSALQKSPIIGSGPNTFQIDWSLWKPASVNHASFWSPDFNNGISTFATFIITTGVLGLISLVFFLFVLFVRCLQSTRVITYDSISNYFICGILSIISYTWIVIICYTPNIIILLLAFVSSGLLVGILVQKKVIRNMEFSVVKRSGKKVSLILGITSLIIVALVILFYVERFTSMILFSRAVQYDNSKQSLNHSESLLANAIALNKSDIYYRALSQVYVNELQVFLSDTSGGDMSTDTVKSTAQQLVNLAQSSAAKAVEANPRQYMNELNLAHVYSSFLPLGIVHSYEYAVLAYNRAILLSPNNPVILLGRAQLEFIHKDNTQARLFIYKALDQNSNYTDALLLLAQVDASENDASSAIKHLESAALLAPSNPNVLFILGSYRYKNGDYSGAIDALESAVVLDTHYLDARYVLGQAYQKAGRIGDALIQYKILEKIQPNNKHIQDALASLNEK